MQVFTPVLELLKEYGRGLKTWMKFWLLNLLIIAGLLYAFNVDVNKAFTAFLKDDPTEMYIQPEKVAEVDKVLSQTIGGIGADGAYIFAYMPLYAIKSTTLLQIHEPRGNNYLSFEQYTNVPITIDGNWYLSMKSQEMYHRRLRAEGVYSNMYHRGVRHFFSYPIMGKGGILYGNLTVVFDEEPALRQEHIKQYLKVGAETIAGMLDLQ